MSGSTTEERARTLLSDLGRATLRGIRKCRRCGVYSGSRGATCKNKTCNAVFKDTSTTTSTNPCKSAVDAAEPKRSKLSQEACKLLTDPCLHIYSVRVRDRGPDHRAFVQFPPFENNNNNNNDDVGCSPLPLQSKDDSAAAAATYASAVGASTTALCFVDNCDKSFKNNANQCHKRKDAKLATSGACQHVQAALRCYAEAQPLTLRNSVLSSLNVSNEIKQDIWLLATESSGPLVQRVSKHIMAVKCKVSPKHPLGYLHFSFITKAKHKDEHKFFCSCSSFKDCKIKENRTDARRCVHFYACVCAFASDPKLSEEFQYYINLDQINSIEESLDFGFNISETEKLIEMGLDSLADDTQLLIFRDDALAIQNLQMDKLDIDGINLDAALLNENIDLRDSNLLDDMDNLELLDENSICDGNTIKIISDVLINTNLENLMDNQPSLVDGALKPSDGPMMKVLENVPVAEPNMQILQSSAKEVNNHAYFNPIEPQKALPMKRKQEDLKNNNSSIANINSIEPKRAKIKASSGMKKYYNTCENIDESSTSLSFTKWLASITERINQTMHFQFSGKPDPLVFHVPQSFFECLRERISGGAKKKRLPNSTTAFVRRDGVPLGTFTKYTWHITNILHVKSIFETSLMPLEITKSFVQNIDGTYEVYKREETEVDKYRKMGNNALIKPMELQTYLKVGNMSPHQVQPTPFLIEWIPDILPISKIGELRIRFEFGHVKNDSPQKYRKIVLSKNC